MMTAAEKILMEMREAGWTVGVHNDYRRDGASFTFWLFTKSLAPSDGLHVKGEGCTDLEALEAARAWAQALVPQRKAEKQALALVKAFICTFELSTRWPCPECGREGPEAPLRHVSIQHVDVQQQRRPVGPLIFTGCMRCTDIERFLKHARDIFQKRDEAFRKGEFK